MIYVFALLASFLVHASAGIVVSGQDIAVGLQQLKSRPVIVNSFSREGQHNASLHLYAYHKSGITLVNKLARALSSHTPAGLDISTGFLPHGDNDERLRTTAMQNNTLRVVVFVRDPILMLASSYLYHKKHPGDARGTQPEMWKNETHGLLMNARPLLGDASSMVSMYQALKNEPNVRFIRLDDLRQNYDAIVAKMIEFGFRFDSSGPTSFRSSAKLTSQSTLAQLVADAVASVAEFDLQDTPVSYSAEAKTRQAHVTPEDEKERLVAMMEGCPSAASCPKELATSKYIARLMAAREELPKETRF